MTSPSGVGELATIGIRWPQKGDKALQKSPVPDGGARIAADARQRMIVMAEGYRKGADIMVDAARTNAFERDYLVYPILFAYRQFIELSLKDLINTYGPDVGVPVQWSSHDLTFLWSQFKLVTKRYTAASGDETDAAVESIIREFAKIDPNSYSYRYPVDTKGMPVPVTHDMLDLDVLKDVLEGVSTYFVGSSDYVDHLKYDAPVETE